MDAVITVYVITDACCSYWPLLRALKSPFTVLVYQNSDHAVVGAYTSMYLYKRSVTDSVTVVRNKHSFSSWNIVGCPATCTCKFPLPMRSECTVTCKKVPHTCLHVVEQVLRMLR